MGFPKGIEKLLGVGCTITNPNGPVTTVTVTGGVSPATTVTGPDTFGAAAVVGTGTKYARDDHDHGLPANPQRTPATTVTGPDAFGAAAVVGTSLLYARQDHDHGLPAAPVAPFATFAGTVGLPSFYNLTAPSFTSTFPYDPVGLTGSAGGTSASVPVLVSAGADVINPAGITVTIVGIDTTHDQFALGGTLLVSNQVGTQVISVALNGLAPIVGPGQTFSLDWSLATPTAQVGTDLVWDAGLAAHVTGGGAPLLPLTVVAGVNDEFVYTPFFTGTPETFTVAPGVYTTLAALEAAVGSAIGSAHAEAFSTIITITNNATDLVFTSVVLGQNDNGDTITPGTHDVTVGLGLANPTTFAGGTDYTLKSTAGGIFTVSFNAAGSWN